MPKILKQFLQSTLQIKFVSKKVWFLPIVFSEEAYFFRWHLPRGYIQVYSTRRNWVERISEVFVGVPDGNIPRNGAPGQKSIFIVFGPLRNPSQCHTRQSGRARDDGPSYDIFRTLAYLWIGLKWNNLRGADRILFSTVFLPQKFCIQIYLFASLLYTCLASNKFFE